MFLKTLKKVLNKKVKIKFASRNNNLEKKKI